MEHRPSDRAARRAELEQLVNERWEQLIPVALERLKEMAAGDSRYANQARKLLAKYRAAGYDV